MPKPVKPPLGAMPRYLWDECVGYDPTLKELADRYDEIFSALRRFCEARRPPKEEWLVELGLVERFPPFRT